MARHTAKSHKIRKVEILVIQIVIVIDSGTVNFSYMLYYVTFANQIICTFSLVLKSPLVKFARLLSVYL